jgi:hypothetical protein
MKESTNLEINLKIPIDYPKKYSSLFHNSLVLF